MVQTRNVSLLNIVSLPDALINIDPPEFVGHFIANIDGSAVLFFLADESLEESRMWLVAPMPTSALMQLLEGKVSLHRILMEYLAVVLEGPANALQGRYLPAEGIDASYLPDQDSFCDVDQELRDLAGKHFPSRAILS